MIVTSREVPAIPASLKETIENDIKSALNAIATTEGKFTVNDRVVFRPKYEDGKLIKATPCVLNKADFMSGSFQKYLVSKNWEKEKLLGGNSLTEAEKKEQAIDAYKEFQFKDAAYTLSRNNYLKLSDELWKQAETSKERPEFLGAYYGYCRRDLFPIPKWAESQKSLFKKSAEKERTLRVGVEFETGNIASSFRAISKLNLLYWTDFIDLGIFVTSASKKEGAARIWPSSNRNGSFQELEQRRYKFLVQLPLWEFAFSPDGYDQTMGYFDKTGKLHYLKFDGSTETLGNSKFEVCSLDGKGNYLVREKKPDQQTENDDAELLEKQFGPNDNNE